MSEISGGIREFPQAGDILRRADEFKIADSLAAKAAIELIQVAAALQREVDDTFDPIIKHAHEGHRDALRRKAKFADPLKLAQSTLKGKLSAWHSAEESARRKAEEELNAKLIVEAQDERLDQAAQREAMGDKAGADALLSAPLPPVAVVIEPEAKPKGASFRDVWKFVIESPSDVPREFCIPDEDKIRKLVNALKGETRIAGVKVYREVVAAVRKAPLVLLVPHAILALIGGM